MDRDADGEEAATTDSDEVIDDEEVPNKKKELADLDPNAEKQARRVERQLRRLQREMRG